MIINQTTKILKENNIFPKKKFGQNFLINPSVLDTILKNSSLDKTKGAIEIGPGLGALTEVLALNSKKVLCYEIDNDMVNILRKTLANYNNIIIENKDFLRVDLNSDISRYFKDVNEIIVTANLPYYITTPILFRLLEHSNLHKFIFMVQKEVGNRLAGKPNTKDYNALSVLMAYKTKTKVIANVSRNSFYPVPNVDSVLLSVQVVKNDYNVKNEAKFLEFIRAIFNQRRKTLVNNISSCYPLGKAKVKKIILNLGHKENIRAEALDINQIVHLYKTMFG